MSQPAPRSGFKEQIFLLLVLAGVVVFASLRLSQTFRPRADVALKVGTLAPPIEGAGWINGDPLTAKDLEGRVYLVEAFAYWCGPCRAETKRLVQLQRHYGDRLPILGMTAEPERALPKTKQFLEDQEVPWPVVYGAEESMIAWGVEGIPETWLIGPDGKVLWNAASNESLTDAIDAALANPPPAKTAGNR
jgi:cytochrome c biogenesis protein CcmG/thiol:disulfide interchange protein DsbE